MEILFFNNSFLIKNKTDINFLKDKNLGFYNKNSYQVDIFEAILILEKYKDVKIIDKDNKLITFEDLMRKVDYNYYIVFRDLKEKGYSVKSGMKYGFPFRVYEKGVKEGEDHSKWLVLPIDSSENVKVIDLIAKARVANSVKKAVIFAFIDNEKKISYYEMRWRRM